MVECVTICDKDLKDFLVWELSIGASEFKLQLSTQLEFIWAVTSEITHGNKELQLLESKKMLLWVLMGCYYGEHDIEQGIANALDETESKRQENQHGNSQSSQHAHSESKSCSVSFYDDSSKGFMEAKAKRQAKSDSYDESQSYSEDKGKGATSLTFCALNTAEASNTSNNSSASASVGRQEGLRKGREYEFNQSNSRGRGGIPLITEWRINVNVSSWDKDMFNKTQSDDANARRGASYQDSESYSKGDRNANRTSCSFFQSAITSCSLGTSDMVSCELAESKRIAYARASGYGETQARYDARSVQAAQGNAEYHSDNSFNSIGQGYKARNFDAVKNSQKFKHLLELYNLANKQIQLAKQVLLTSQGYFTSQRLLDNETCCSLNYFFEKTLCNNCHLRSCRCNKSMPFSYNAKYNSKCSTCN
jgi:hypothetical protein